MVATSGQQSPYLIGKLLLSMPQMGDPRFTRSVIYICAHDENGAMGLVINDVLPDLKFESLLEKLNIQSDIHFAPEALSLPVMRGGPVDPGRGFLLHSDEFSQKETISLDAGISVTGTLDALKKVAEGDGPKDKLFILGYAGWSAGQLEQEIQDNAWLICNSDPDILFSAAHEEKWDKAIAQLGIDPAMLSGVSGSA